MRAGVRPGRNRGARGAALSSHRWCTGRGAGPAGTSGSPVPVGRTGKEREMTWGRVGPVGLVGLPSPFGPRGPGGPFLFFSPFLLLGFCFLFVFCKTEIEGKVWATKIL